MKRIIPMALLVLVFACSEKYKKDPAAIYMVQGEVKVVRPGQETVAAQAGQKVYAGDLLLTGKDSMAVVLFQESRVELNDNTSIEIRDFIKPNQDQGSNTALFIKKGKMLVKATLRKDEGDKLSVSTSTLVAAVRGTVFSMENREGASRIECMEGEVLVSDPQGNREPMVLKEGSFLSVDSDGKVTTGTLDKPGISPGKALPKRHEVKNFSEKPSALMPTAR